MATYEEENQYPEYDEQGRPVYKGQSAQQSSQAPSQPTGPTYYDPQGNKGGNSGVAGPQPTGQQPVTTPTTQPPATPQQPVDTSIWDTDGYSKPSYTAQNAGNAPAGWDQTKWADPNHQTPKYVVGRILTEAAAGTGNLADPARRQQAVDRIIQAYPGARFDGKDKITMPDGGVVDIFGGAGAGQFTPAWMPVTGPGGQPLPGEEPIYKGQGPPLQTNPDMLPGGGGIPGGPGAGGPGAGGRGINDPRWDALYDELVRRSQQSLEVNPNDPIIKGQVDAATAIANREALKQQQTAAARGGPYATGATANAQRMSNEGVQMQAQAMQFELMGREVAARRQEIAQAFQQRGNMMTVEEQSRLRELDQQLAREEMQLDNQLGLAQLALSRENAQQNWNDMAWRRGFQDRDWESDLAQTNWENEYKLWY